MLYGAECALLHVAEIGGGGGGEGGGLVSRVILVNEIFLLVKLCEKIHVTDDVAPRFVINAGDLLVVSLGICEKIAAESPDGKIKMV